MRARLTRWKKRKPAAVANFCDLDSSALSINPPKLSYLFFMRLLTELALLRDCKNEPAIAQIGHSGV